MKHLSAMLRAAILLTISSAPVFASVVYSNKPSPTGGAILSIQYPAYTDPEYDEFSLADATTVKSVSWYGSRIYDAPPMNYFLVNFYDKQSGVAGTLLSSQYVVGTANESGVRLLGGGINPINSENTYSANVNFQAAANTEYFISIVAGEQPPNSWYWTLAANSPGDFAFTLDDASLPNTTMTATPEPSSLALMGTGLLSAVGVMKRRSRRSKA